MTREVMIQDVDPANALIFLHGYMYVGSCKMLPSPRWFAPYFTEDCPTAGVDRYSWVLEVIDVGATALRAHPNRAIGLPTHILRHPNWPHWEWGLTAIAHRAKSERNSTGELAWTSESRLYFLDVPILLNTTIKKAGQSQIVPGFGCSFADLLEMRDLSDVRRP